MASTVILTTFIIVVSVSVFSEQHYLNNLHKSIPNHWQHDQEELGRRVDQVPWRNKVKKHSRPLLNLRQPIPWHQWTHQGRLGHKEKDIEAQKIRRHLLEEKLKLNHAIPRYGGQILPQAKPKVKGAGQEIHRAKRAVKQTNDNIPNTNDYKPKPIVNSRKKREIIIVPQLQPELVGVRSQAQAQFQNKLEKKREKRQILYLINRPAQILQRRRRTTPNPFIRETDIKHYDIGSADLREQFIPGGAGNSDSYEISETSDLEYESDYTISMSDSEDWENYPLTTPSGPNPGWCLSTLAIIYQIPKHKQPPANLANKHISQADLHRQSLTMIRMKRSPKLKKRKIGAYKEKLKKRRKNREMRRKRRIIRNSKEDKAVKEMPDEKIVEELLNKPKPKWRKTSYDETSLEILWSNRTHRIIEDKDATFKWLNNTHYMIYNVTDGWYNQDRVLVFNEKESENKMNKKEEEERSEQDKTDKSEPESKDYSEEYNEEFTQEEKEETGSVQKVKAISDKNKKKKIGKNKRKAAEGHDNKSKIENESDLTSDSSEDTSVPNDGNLGSKDHSDKYSSKISDEVTGNSEGKRRSKNKKKDSKKTKKVQSKKKMKGKKTLTKGKGKSGKKTETDVKEKDKSQSTDSSSNENLAVKRVFKIEVLSKNMTNNKLNLMGKILQPRFNRISNTKSPYKGYKTTAKHKSTGEVHSLETVISNDTIEIVDPSMNFNYTINTSGELILH